jgi:glycosyltransferase involved in cell wall biosynthesis
MSAALLSILMPCYNEESMIEEALRKVTEAKCGIPKEIIVIDDGSTDNSAARIDHFIQSNPGAGIKLYRHSANQGKGSCIRTGLAAASGDIILIQDADLEYDPVDYPRLLHPILDGRADVVYGSRFMGGEAHRILFFVHKLANKFLTFLSNVFTGLNLTDMESGYKVFRTEVLKRFTLKENRFGFEPEVTAKISKIKNLRIYEIGVAYFGRTYTDGKKIRWYDGVRAIYCIVKYNLFSRVKNAP